MKRGNVIRMFALLLVAAPAVMVHTASQSKEPAAPAVVADSQDAGLPPGEVPKAPDQKEPRVVDRAQLSPLHREIFDSSEAERARVEVLNERYLKATSPDEKRTIQQEIESVKKEGMIAVFEIQLRYARAEQRTDAVRQLETVIEAMRHPKTLEGSGPRMIERGDAGRSAPGQ